MSISQFVASYAFLYVCIQLLLEFSANLGTVEVTITNSVGEVVYKQSVEAQPSVVISLEEEMRDGDVVLVTDGENVIYGSL